MLNEKKLLTKLLNRVGETHTTVSAINSITGELNLVIDKSTNTVRGYGYARRSTDINIATAIFNIPSAYRPSADVKIPMFLYSSSGVNAAYYGVAHPSGDINQLLGSTIREIFTAFEYKLGG